MSEFQRTDYYSSTGDTLRAYVNKVMVRMGCGLALTGGVAFLLYTSLIRGGFFYSILSTMYSPLMVICRKDVTKVIKGSATKKTMQLKTMEILSRAL